MAALLVASEPAFLVLKLAGAAYLIFLGGQALLARRARGAAVADARRARGERPRAAPGPAQQPRQPEDGGLLQQPAAPVRRLVRGLLGLGLAVLRDDDALARRVRDRGRAGPATSCAARACAARSTRSPARRSSRRAAARRRRASRGVVAMERFETIIEPFRSTPSSRTTRTSTRRARTSSSPARRRPTCRSPRRARQASTPVQGQHGRLGARCAARGAPRRRPRRVRHGDEQLGRRAAGQPLEPAGGARGLRSPRRAAVPRRLPLRRERVAHPRARARPGRPRRRRHRPRHGGARRRHDDVRQEGRAGEHRRLAGGARRRARRAVPQPADPHRGLPDVRRPRRPRPRGEAGGRGRRPRLPALPHPLDRLSRRRAARCRRAGRAPDRRPRGLHRRGSAAAPHRAAGVPRPGAGVRAVRRGRRARLRDRQRHVRPAARRQRGARRDRARAPRDPAPHLHPEPHRLRHRGRPGGGGAGERAARAADRRRGATLRHFTARFEPLP